MKNNLLVLGTKNFNNSLKEIKEYISFTLVFFNKDNYIINNPINICAILVDSNASNIDESLNIIGDVSNKPLLFLEGQTPSYSNHTEIMNFPLKLEDLNTKIINLITSSKFNQNSSIKINDYIMDKNEKKLKNKKLSISITEREIELIELLFNEKKSLSINNILKRVWKYSEGVDTHTVETHIYRLRKKILNKFKDENFITNSNVGYTI